MAEELRQKRSSHSQTMVEEQRSGVGGHSTAQTMAEEQRREQGATALHKHEGYKHEG